MKQPETALIVGAGSGLSASLARLFAKEGMRVALAARDTSKLASLVKETSAFPIACDATDLSQIEAMFAAVEAKWGVPDLVVYNAGYRARGPLIDLAPKGIHVAHFVIDGGISKSASDPRAHERGADGMLVPDEIAKNYLHVFRQHRSAWTWEVELRPWVERFCRASAPREARERGRRSGEAGALARRERLPRAAEPEKPAHAETHC